MFYEDEYATVRLQASDKETDPVERNKIMEEAFISITEGVPTIPFAYPGLVSYAWPWVKNWYGEGWYNIHTPGAHNWWIDQDLKAEMGY